LDYAAEEAKAPAHWSALALLPLLAKSLSSVPHQCTLKLVAFPGREHGMRSAMGYVSQLTEAQRKTLRALVDLAYGGVNPSVGTRLRLAHLASHVNLLATYKFALASRRRKLLGGVYLPDLLQFCLKSYRLAAANCEIMQVS
jgi:hypothetical protein